MTQEESWLSVELTDLSLTCLFLSLSLCLSPPSFVLKLPRVIVLVLHARLNLSVEDSLSLLSGEREGLTGSAFVVRGLGSIFTGGNSTGPRKVGVLCVVVSVSLVSGPGILVVRKGEGDVDFCSLCNASYFFDSLVAVFDSPPVEVLMGLGAVLGGVFEGFPQTGGLGVCVASVFAGSPTGVLVGLCGVFGDSPAAGSGDFILGSPTGALTGLGAVFGGVFGGSLTTEGSAVFVGSSPTGALTGSVFGGSPLGGLAAVFDGFSVWDMM